MKSTAIIAAAATLAISAGGFVIAQEIDEEGGRKDRRSGQMLEKVTRTLDLDESQQAAWETFTGVVREQFPGRRGRSDDGDSVDREAAREAMKADRESRQAALEGILLSPEFDVEAFKAIRQQDEARRAEFSAEREARMEEMRAAAEVSTDVILAAYADFHRTLTDEQRQKLVWLAEQRGGGILASVNGGGRDWGGRRGKDGRSFRR